MTFALDKLKKDILEGCAAGETVTVSRETFWHVEWPKGHTVQVGLGNFLAELRAVHCISHGVRFEGYEFFKVGKQR